MNEGMSYKQSRYAKVLERFSQSGYTICEVNINDKNLSKQKISDISSRLREAAIRYGRPHIRVFTNNGKVYLVNKLKSC